MTSLQSIFAAFLAGTGCVLFGVLLTIILLSVIASRHRFRNAYQRPLPEPYKDGSGCLGALLAIVFLGGTIVFFISAYRVAIL